MNSFELWTNTIKTNFVIIIDLLSEQLAGHVGDEGLADRDVDPVIRMLGEQSAMLQSAESIEARYNSIRVTVQRIAEVPDPVGSMRWAALLMPISFARLQKMARARGLTYA